MNSSKILVAGVGNIFLGDDAFGVEVARRLVERPLPVGVRAQDFGIRSFDLAFALDTAQTIILVDATARGGVPGTLYTIEPDLISLEEISTSAVPDGHSMNPVEVLRLARRMNVVPGKILLVGCEPATLEPAEEGMLGLSPAVEEAAGRAVELIESMCERILADHDADHDADHGAKNGAGNLASEQEQTLVL